jgi:hypothetical protein
MLQTCMSMIVRQVIFTTPTIRRSCCKSNQSKMLMLFEPDYTNYTRRFKYEL